MLLMPEPLGVANPLLRNATSTHTSTLRIAPEFRARARAVFVAAARGLGAVPPADEFGRDLEGEPPPDCAHPPGRGGRRKIARISGPVVVVLLRQDVDPRIPGDAHTQETAHHGVRG